MQPKQSKFKHYPNLTWAQFMGWLKDKVLCQHKLISNPFVRHD